MAKTFGKVKVDKICAIFVIYESNLRKCLYELFPKLAKKSSSITPFIYNKSLKAAILFNCKINKDFIFQQEPEFISTFLGYLSSIFFGRLAKKRRRRRRSIAADSFM